MVIASDLKLATLAELQTIYGSEDLQNFIEVILVNAHNARVAEKKAEKKR